MPSGPLGQIQVIYVYHIDALLRNDNFCVNDYMDNGPHPSFSCYTADHIDARDSSNSLAMIIKEHQVVIALQRGSGVRQTTRWRGQVGLLLQWSDNAL